MTAALAVISFVVFNYVPEAFHSQTWPFVLLFFVLTNSILYFFYLRIHSRKVTSFANFLCSPHQQNLFSIWSSLLFICISTGMMQFPLCWFFLYYVFYTILK